MKFGISEQQSLLTSTGKPIGKGSRGYLRLSGSLKRFQNTWESVQQIYF